jgi:hypothetical protein
LKRKKDNPKTTKAKQNKNKNQKPKTKKKKRHLYMGKSTLNKEQILFSVSCKHFMNTSFSKNIFNRKSHHRQRAIGDDDYEVLFFCLPTNLECWLGMENILT